MRRYDIIVIGGGPAGLAAALAARENGIESVLILERDRELGGILNQCIHNGFGLHTFQEELTGPEYAARFIRRVQEAGLEYRLNAMVLSLRRGGEAPSSECVEASPADDGRNVEAASADDGRNMEPVPVDGVEPSPAGCGLVVTAISREDGLFELQARAVVLAMGCRERSRGALSIPGYRPAGIFSAGTAQRLVNMEGYLPGREVVILGSGDIGLIMARRMTLEGAKVKVVAELMPYSGGLKRNIVQCLDDFNIPLKLSHTVVDIQGKERVTGVTIAQVDEHRRPIPGTEEFYSCDTLLLSCGLIPENELSRELGVELNPVTAGPVVDESLETSVPGVFACGNVLHVHDLVDFVSQEAAMAGKCAAEYVKCEGGVGMLQPGERGAWEALEPGKCGAGEALEPGECGDKEAPEPGGCRVGEAWNPDGCEEACKSGMRGGEGQMTGGGHGEDIVLPVRGQGGVRYTVPSRIHPARMAKEQVIRFRVGDVYKNQYVSVYVGGRRVIHRRRPVMAPGEMEEVRLRREWISGCDEGAEIVVAVEGE